MTASSLVGLARPWSRSLRNRISVQVLLVSIRPYRYIVTRTTTVLSNNWPVLLKKINLNYSLTPQIPSYCSRRQQNTPTQPCFSACRGSGSSPRILNSAALVLCWRITGELIITPFVDDYLTCFCDITHFYSHQPTYLHIVCIIQCLC